MKKFWLCSSALMISVLLPVEVQAALATWNFSTAAGGPLNSYAASSQDPHASGTAGMSSSGGAATPSVNGGVLIYSFTKGNVANLNNCVLQIRIVAGNANFSTLSAQYDATLTTVNSLNLAWSYSINGATPVSAGASRTLTASGTAFSDSFNPGIVLGSGQTLDLYLTFTGAHAANNGSAGSLTFDNFSINAGSTTVVPEPVTCALPIFGAAFVFCMAGGSFWSRRIKAV